MFEKICFKQPYFKHYHQTYCFFFLNTSVQCLNTEHYVLSWQTKRALINSVPQGSPGKAGTGGLIRDEVDIGFVTIVTLSLIIVGVRTRILVEQWTVVVYGLLLGLEFGL